MTTKNWPTGQWTTNLFDCWDDPSLCVKTCFCPCVTIGEVVEILDQGTTSKGHACLLAYAMGSIHCGWIYGRRYRRKLREIFKLPETPYSDTFTSCCCCVCGICQEYRELQNRGANPSLGWEGNVEKWKREGLTVPPIPTSPMNR
ncbi:hypothetical protein HAX54_030943 [Datura stramonium]|uniref:Uncharacterized protein n=1 Tax=Datura stramonium TaxID=4076 RepID=A0ABS8SBH6_DATST|nr:hypothetical protein [Datura stramonium]